MFEYLTAFVQENSVSTLLAISVILLFWWKRGPHTNLPPGPRPLPIIGNMGHLLDTVNGFSKLRKTYGDVFTLKVGNTMIVVLNGYTTVKEMFVKHGEVTSHRPDLCFFREILQHNGILMASGRAWKQHRSLSLTTLRDFGVGKRSMESKIMEEVEEFLKLIESYQGEAFDLDRFVQTSVSNVICSIVFGQRYEHHDHQHERLLKMLQEQDQYSGSCGIINFFPLLRYIPGDPFKGNRFRSSTEEIMKFIGEQVKHHLDELDVDNPRDFIDVYLNHMEKIKDTEERQEIFTDDQLYHVINDLFAAGTETTSASILWSILYFLHNPSVQDKMHDELNRVVGNGRSPSLNDKENLPYCQAVITEVLRCGNVIPLSVPHSTSQDLIFRGYTIPKGTLLMPNMSSILNDDQLIKNPGEFNPDRYIDNNGRFDCPEQVMPFSIGRRRCLGENLARSELFLFLTNMVQRFQFKPENADDLPLIKGVIGVTHKPDNYKFRAILRV